MSTTQIPADLTSGQLTTDIIKELWAFYQFSMQDEEVRKKFDQFRLYRTLKKEYD